MNKCESTLLCSKQSTISGWAFTLPVISRTRTIGQMSLVGAGQRTHPVSSLVGLTHTSSVQGQGSMSMGMIVRMTSSLPRRTTTRKLVSFLTAALTSVAEEIRWPLIEMMTSCSLSPPLQKRQRRGKKHLRRETTEHYNNSFWLRSPSLQRLHHRNWNLSSINSKLLDFPELLQNSFQNRCD